MRDSSNKSSIFPDYAVASFHDMSVVETFIGCRSLLPSLHNLIFVEREMYRIFGIVRDLCGNRDVTEPLRKSVVRHRLC